MYPINFPYHVRTTQIGIMEALSTANTSLGPNTLDRFANNGSYGVTVATSMKAYYELHSTYNDPNHAAATSGMDVFTVDSATRPLPHSANHNPYVPNGIPQWSITNHTVPHQNGTSAPPPKIYDPNDDADSTTSQ